MKSLFVLFVAVLYFVKASQDEETPVFRENAAEFVEVGYSKGRGGRRVTEIAVSVEMGEMFDEGVDVNEDDLFLEFKTGSECWKKVGGSPVRRGKEKRMWRVKVVPCQEYSVRLGVARAGCVEYLEYHHTIGPATPEEIAASHYRPETPGNVVVTAVSDDSVVVSWDESYCGESYDLWYESDSGLDLGNITVTAGVGEVTIAGLENCTDYTIYVVALLGAEFSDDAEADFTTCLVNKTTTPDPLIIGKVIQNSCEVVETECKFSTGKNEELSDLELFKIEEDIKEPSSLNETIFDAHTGHSNSSPHISKNNFIFKLLSTLIVSSFLKLCLD